jgi:hypothetical protein
MTNEALREHVTSIGFSLTLSKRMIDTLVALDHFKGDFHALTQWEDDAGVDTVERTRRRVLFSHYVVTYRSLESRGLVVRKNVYLHKDPKCFHLDQQKSRHSLTKAGKLMVGLLKEAGLYDERLAEMELTDKETVT